MEFYLLNKVNILFWRQKRAKPTFCEADLSQLRKNAVTCDYLIMGATILDVVNLENSRPFNPHLLQ